MFKRNRIWCATKTYPEQCITMSDGYLNLWLPFILFSYVGHKVRGDCNFLGLCAPTQIFYFINISLTLCSNTMWSSWVTLVCQEYIVYANTNFDLDTFSISPTSKSQFHPSQVLMWYHRWFLVIIYNNWSVLHLLLLSIFNLTWTSHSASISAVSCLG